MRVTLILLAAFLTAALLLGDLPANAFGLGGLGNRFGRLGAATGKVTVIPPPPSCVSPTAPNGVVDLSQCSNAFYVALVF